MKNIYLNFTMIEKFKYKLSYKWFRFTHQHTHDAGMQKIKEQTRKCKKIKVDTEVIIQLQDIIWSENIKSYIYQDLSIDSIIKFKEIYPQWFRYSGFENITNKMLKNRSDYQRLYYNSAKGIFTMSKWLHDSLINDTGIPANKVHWVGAGINQPRNIISVKERQRNKILFVGRDFLRKGGDIVYEAVKYLNNQKMINVELYIAGPDKLPIKENLPSYVHYLGDMKYEDLTYYFHICDVFCMPSRFEPYGLVFAEALCAGMPCIGRNAYAMPEFIKNGINGYLIENDDVINLANVIEKVLRDERIYNYVNKNNNKYIQQYSWDAVASRMLKVIKEHSC